MRAAHLRWVLPLAVLPLLALLSWGLTRSPATLPSTLVGRPAPDFELPSLRDDTDSLGLADYRGGVVVLNYWASWCVPCIAEHAELVRLSESYPSSPVQLVGVLFQDERENGRRFMSRMGGEWPIVTDEGSRTSIRYGVYGVPETFFIGADGVVAYRQVGPVTWPLIVSKVDSLLAAGRLLPSEPVDPLETSYRPETAPPANR